jgi:hypothetical protein
VFATGENPRPVRNTQPTNPAAIQYSEMLYGWAYRQFRTIFPSRNYPLSEYPWIEDEWIDLLEDKCINHRRFLEPTKAKVEHVLDLEEASASSL